MKKKQLLILSIFLCFFANSFGQNINFPDPYFKKLLTTYSQYTPYDSNRDGEISIQEAQNVTRLTFYGQSSHLEHLTDLTGIEHFSNLEELVIPGHEITNLNLSQNTKLTHINVRNNLLTNINIDNLQLLTSLYAGNNQLTTFNCSTNILLNHLEIPENQLTQINLNNNINLKNLFINNNLLTSIDARNCSLNKLILGNNPNLKYALLTNQPFKYIPFDYDPNNPPRITFDTVNLINCPNLEFICVDAIYVQEAEDRKLTAGHSNYAVNTDCSFAPIDGCPIINFPDPNFKQALLSHTSPVIDTDGDGEICIEEAEKVILLYKSLENKNITDITGIEYFINLEGISLENNSIATADFSNNLKLRTIHIDNNKLTSINILNNTELISLSANKNLLNTIDVSKNKKLFSLSVYYNKLKQLDVSNLPLLFVVYAWDNEITSLKTINSTSLGEVLVYNNLITNLDLNTNINLYRLHVGNNKLEEIDVRNCKISNLNLENNISLKKAYLTGNHEIYESFDHFIPLPTPGNGNGITINNCPNLEFVCVNNVSFFNDIKNWITNKYPSCTVSTDCDSTAPVVDFNTYFSLSPNPTTGAMWLTRNSSKISASFGSIYNAQTGAFVKGVTLFKDGRLDPFKTIDDNLNPIDIITPIDDAPNSVFIDVSDLQNGYYIFKVHSSLGEFSTKFLRSTLGHF